MFAWNSALAYAEQFWGHTVTLWILEVEIDIQLVFLNKRVHFLFVQHRTRQLENVWKGRKPWNLNLWWGYCTYKKEIKCVLAELPFKLSRCKVVFSSAKCKQNDASNTRCSSLSMIDPNEITWLIGKTKIKHAALIGSWGTLAFPKTTDRDISDEELNKQYLAYCLFIFFFHR